MKQRRFRLRWLLGVCALAGILVLGACNGTNGTDPTPAAPTVEGPAATEPTTPTEPTDEAAEEPAEDATSEATEETAEEATAEATEEPAEEATPEATEEPSEEATEEPAEDAAVPVGEVVAEGFQAPMGIHVADDGSIWVVESGVGGDEEIAVTGPQGPVTATMGLTARVIQIGADGTQTEVAALPSLLMGAESSGGAHLVLLDGVPYVTVGVYIGAPEDEVPPLFGAVARLENGEAVEVANTWAFEAENNPDGFVHESHPYGITVDNEGNLLVTDAGANDLLRIDPATGEIELVAVFPGIPGLPFPNSNRDGAMELDPVPTGVVVAEDGTIFVSYLPGFPPIPGGKVVTVDPATGEVSDYATNVSMLTDIVMGPDGQLYAVHLADFGEQGPMPNTGSILRILEGEASEQVVGGLPFPTAIDFDEEGNAYIIINGIGAPGSGAVLKVDALTEIEGEPLPAPAPAPN